LHTRQQTIAMWDTETRELIETTLTHEGDEVREFYSATPPPSLCRLQGQFPDTAFYRRGCQEDLVPP
jgi:hypothetical protein